MNVAPANPRLGLMLAYSPLHRLLLEAVDMPLVVTSGNLSGEPLCTDQLQALNKLGAIADLFMVHNRTIEQPLDDSVVQVVCGEPMMLRRARGYAPGLFKSDPIAGDVDMATVLALGSHLKNTLSVVKQRQVFLGAHIGDLDTIAAREAHQYQRQQLQSRFGATVVSGDQHPSTQRVSITVQHHHAHIVATMIEHHIQQPVLGIAWDGFGWGADDTAWGGEWLVCDTHQYQRVASIKPFALPGNDYAAKETGRAALGCVYAACQDLSEDTLQQMKLEESARFSLFLQMLESNINTTTCSSVGRLFDAVAFIFELTDTNQFEGQAAMAVQFAAETARQTYKHGALPSHSLCSMTIRDLDGLLRIDWGDTLLDMLRQKQAGSSVNELAWLFHQVLVNATIELIGVLTNKYGAPKTIVLGGGCFSKPVIARVVSWRFAST